VYICVYDCYVCCGQGRLAVVRALITTLILSFTMLVALSGVGAAASSQDELTTICASAGDKPSYCSTVKTTNSPISGTAGVINKVTDIIAFAAGAVAVIMVIYGGFTYIISNGDPSKITKARQIIIYALAGLVIIILAREIVVFVINKLL